MKTTIISIFCSMLILQVGAYSNQKAGFEIQVNGEQNPYKIYSTFVMPGAAVTITSTSEISVSAGELTTIQEKKTKWILTAPDTPGSYAVEIRDIKDRSIQLNVLVLTPMELMKGEYLNGFRVGNYPAKPYKDNPIYNKPKGMFEVTLANLNLQLTPHFTLGQFLCKQAGGYPKYVIVRERLLLKLEYLLERVNEKGFEVETFGFISGYRTPFYNASINNVPYSRHVYGGAADIFIDQNKDGGMDDLNQDGVVDEKDVRIFYNIVADEFDKPGYDKFKGGLGFYRKNGRHNGFIHVDVRGWKARW